MMAMRLSMWMVAAVLCACGASLSPAQVNDLRQQLRTAMDEGVPDSATRERHSRLLNEVGDHGELEGMSYPELRAAFGPGSACRNEICERYGFTGNDFYYPIGREADKGVGQLPWLMIGLDPRGRVARVFTLTTH
jgi:hypothetical protein